MVTGHGYNCTVLVGAPSLTRVWWDGVRRFCGSVLEKTELWTRDCRPTGSVCVCRKKIDALGFPLACCALNLNQVMLLLLGWVNNLNIITNILQRGYLGSTDRHLQTHDRKQVTLSSIFERLYYLRLYYYFPLLSITVITPWYCYD